MSNINLYDFIDEIQDFPKKGILFRDINPLLEDKDAFKLLILKMIHQINNYKIDLIAGTVKYMVLVGSDNQEVFCFQRY